MLNWPVIGQVFLAFIEAVLTVEVAGLGGVMVNQGTYTWPTWPAVAFITMGAALAGVRRVNSLFRVPPGS